MFRVLDAPSGVRTREVCTFDILGRSSDKSWILIPCFFKLKCSAYPSTGSSVFLKTLGSAVQARCRTTSRRHVCLFLWLDAVISFCLAHYAPAATIIFLFLEHMFAVCKSRAFAVSAVFTSAVSLLPHHDFIIYNDSAQIHCPLFI